MFAIVKTDSRQIQVTPGQLLSVDFRPDLQPGDTIEFGEVLIANGGGASQIGKPLISGAKVVAEVIDPLAKGKKLEIGKFRRRKNSKRHTGHRQKYTTVRITGIDVPGLEIVEKQEEKPATSPA